MARATLVDVGQKGRWDNYHRTGHSELLARFALRSGDSGRGRDDIAQGAAEVHGWLLRAREEGIPVRPVGGAWSPSNIQTVRQGWMLNTRRFNRCFRVAPEDLIERFRGEASGLMLVEGGVQIDEINDKLQEMGRSLRTTGASNGQTMPGACATATHGSVPGCGGIQEHVRAVQIVTPSGVHWIEPAAGLMSDDFIRDTGSAALRDDEAFQAALVAVGSLGIVTAMVIDSDPIFLVRPWMKLIDFSRDDLELLERGDFLAFSERHGLPREPYFTMVITNPFKPFARKAVVKFLYKEPWRADYQRHEPSALGAGYDSFSLVNWALRNFPWARGWILQLIMRLAVGKGITQERYGTWGETTETHKPLALPFTGAIFCDRRRLVETFETLCRSFSGAGGSTAVTLRFEKGGPAAAHGLLSPARWPETAGLDCDGPDSKRTRDAFLGMLDALDRANIPFTTHWGKFGRLDAVRVARDYGTDLARFKAVQQLLLPGPADLRLFASDELDALGLTVRP